LWNGVCEAPRQPQRVGQAEAILHRIRGQRHGLFQVRGGFGGPLWPPPAALSETVCRHPTGTTFAVYGESHRAHIHRHQGQFRK
jgi:hypothetical protein